MPRTARVVLPNCPHPVVQRGHNRSVVFTEAADYRRYLDTLADWKVQFGYRVYAYCLMTNHVHLVIDPGEDPVSLGRLMKRLAGRQTRWVNRLERRSGSLWESRYKSSPIETDAYLLACCEEERRLIRDAVQRGQLTGSDRFRREVEARIGRRIECRGPGRPSARSECGGK